MRILMLTRLYHPHIGGVEKHVQKISKALSKKGHNITIITEKYNKKLEDNQKDKGINIIRFSYLKIKYFGLIIIWIQLLKQIKYIRQSDIIHIHDVFIWYMPFRLLFPRKKVYITFHGWEGKYPIPKINIVQKQIANKLTQKSICVGKYIEKYYKIKCNKVIYGAVDVPKKTYTKKTN